LKIRLAFAVLVLALIVPAAMTQAQQAPNRVNTTCAWWNKRVQVDPIVQPGIQVSNHLHDFYGRIDVSDYMFVRAPWPLFPGHEDDPGYFPISTSCALYGDWASYWFPTPKFNGVNIASGQLQLTWQSPAGSQVASPPFGMLAIVGNAQATSQVEQGANVRWTCGDLDGAGFASPQTCATGTVTAELTFPDCWDGHRQLADHYAYPAGIRPTHFAYSVGGTCTSSHPTRIAQLVLRQHFIAPGGSVMTNPRNADGTVGLSFASGPYFTYHGDFLNSWNIGLKEVLVDRCLNHIGNPCPLP
jgi:hypothetical protein